MKLGKIEEATKVIIRYSNERISYATAYKFAKFIKDTDMQCEFYNSKIQEILKEYAEKDDNGNMKMKEGVNSDEFSDKIKILSDTDVEAPKIKFKLSDFSDLKVSAKEMLALSEFIEEE